MKAQSAWLELSPSAAGGGIVWLVLVASRLSSLTRLTLIDLLFLLALPAFRRSTSTPWRWSMAISTRLDSACWG
jgi:hypothetical protein